MFTFSTVCSFCSTSFLTLQTVYIVKILIFGEFCLIVLPFSHSGSLHIPGADPGFQVRGAHLKKLHRAEGGAKIFGAFRVKNHDFTSKNYIFSNFSNFVYNFMNCLHVSVQKYFNIFSIYQEFAFFPIYQKFACHCIHVNCIFSFITMLLYYQCLCCHSFL